LETFRPLALSRRDVFEMCVTIMRRAIVHIEQEERVRWIVRLTVSHS